MAMRYLAGFDCSIARVAGGHIWVPHFSRLLREVGATTTARRCYKSSTLNPVCFAIRASIFGPISTLS
jgi:hypothetical protein